MISVGVPAWFHHHNRGLCRPSRDILRRHSLLKKCAVKGAGLLRVNSRPQTGSLYPMAIESRLFLLTKSTVFWGFSCGQWGGTSFAEGVLSTRLVTAAIGRHPARTVGSLLCPIQLLAPTRHVDYRGARAIVPSSEPVLQ